MPYQSQELLHRIQSHLKNKNKYFLIDPYTNKILASNENVKSLFF